MPGGGIMRVVTRIIIHGSFSVRCPAIKLRRIDRVAGSANSCGLVSGCAGSWCESSRAGTCTRSTYLRLLVHVYGRWLADRREMHRVQCLFPWLRPGRPMWSTLRPRYIIPRAFLISCYFSKKNCYTSERPRRSIPETPPRLYVPGRCLVCTQAPLIRLPSCSPSRVLDSATRPDPVYRARARACTCVFISTFYASSCQPVAKFLAVVRWKVVGGRN